MRRAFGLAVLAAAAVVCVLPAEKVKEPPYNPAVPQKLPTYDRRMPACWTTTRTSCSPT